MAVSLQNDWTFAETESLKVDWHVMNIAELKEKYRRSTSSLRHKAHRMGLGRRFIGHKASITWTVKEGQSLVKDWPEMNEKDLVVKYGRTFKAIHLKAMRMGLSRDRLQSYRVKVEDFEGNLVYDHTIERGENAKATLKSIIPKLRAMNKRAIDRGEWIMSITHGLECF